MNYGYPPPPWYGYYPPPATEPPKRGRSLRKLFKAKDLPLDEAIEVRDRLDKFIEEQIKLKKEKEKKPEKAKGLNLSFSTETLIMMVFQIPVIWAVVTMMKVTGSLN